MSYISSYHNGRPRKCLNWKTAHEVFTEEVLRLICLTNRRHEKFLLLGRKHDAHLPYSFSLLFRKKNLVRRLGSGRSFFIQLIV